MAAEDQVILILYVLLGAVAGIIYALRRIILLERRLIGMEDMQIRIEKALLSKLSTTKKSSKRKKRR